MNYNFISQFRYLKTSWLILTEFEDFNKTHTHRPSCGFNKIQTIGVFFPVGRFVIRSRKVGASGQLQCRLCFVARMLEWPWRHMVLLEALWQAAKKIGKLIHMAPLLAKQYSTAHVYPRNMRIWNIIIPDQSQYFLTWVVPTAERWKVNVKHEISFINIEYLNQHWQ